MLYMITLLCGGRVFYSHIMNQKYTYLEKHSIFVVICLYYVTTYPIHTSKKMFSSTAFS